MKATMTKTEYAEFVEAVDEIKRKANIDINHSVTYDGDSFIVEILDKDINLEYLDEILLDKEEQVWYNSVSWATEQALYLQVLVGLVLTTTPRVVGSTLSLTLTTSNLIIGGKYDSRRNCVLGKY